MKNKTIPKPKIPTPPNTNTHKKMTRYYSAPITSCFRPSSTVPTLNHHHPPPSTTTTTTTNLTTSLYQTHLGIVSLTWSRSLLCRHLHFSLSSTSSSSSPSPSSSSPSFNLSLKPFLFWNKQGIKKLTISPLKSIWIFWDLTNARFGSGPEPDSGFYFALLFDGEMILLVGDMEKEAYSKTRAKRVMNSKKQESLVLRREHMVGKNKCYTTKTDLGGKSRTISIELNENFEEDPRLVIRFDQKRVLQVKHLKWKFRGSDRIEVDGHPIQLSWDVHNWLFESEDDNIREDGYALFTFRFEKQGNEDEEEDPFEEERERGMREKGEVMTWTQDTCGLNYEKKKMKKRLMMKKSTSPSSSSSSISSVSSGSSSVLEWESVEENELKGPSGFSLLVYAWKS